MIIIDILARLGVPLNHNTTSSAENHIADPEMDVLMAHMFLKCTALG